ncbi:unnamed protein product [Paramecium pentaurelia]|uniref:C2H2-type domain-containing protein n=1 Tax=Paramecium pentaurelia TaxID=43138 RepID=A0A8S1VSC6_9CILI|nr:unnamed protein product [Paramecium pentaurelia]
MIIEENQKIPENISQIISAKEQYLSATKQLIEMFERKLSMIQKAKQPKSLAAQIYEVQLLCKQQEQDQQLKNQDDFNIQSLDILKYHKTQKLNQIIQTSSRKVYKCYCHNKLFKTPQELGGHLKSRKKHVIRENTIE